MDKLIIHNETTLPHIVVLLLVGKVIDMGMISETSFGKQYCFATTFNISKEDYPTGSGRWVVYVRKNKSGSQAFKIMESQI